jgi:bacterioferritin-associated ferredoxin
MIICSCNVLSDEQILATLASEGGRPRTPAQAYRCLGCAPDCGRCLVTVRKLLAEARRDGRSIGCAVCPGLAGEGRGPSRRQPQPSWVAE